MCRITMDSALLLGVAAVPVLRAADTTPHATSTTRYASAKSRSVDAS
jgi:hypothetical protein